MMEATKKKGKRAACLEGVEKNLNLRGEPRVQVTMLRKGTSSPR